MAANASFNGCVVFNNITFPCFEDRNVFAPGTMGIQLLRIILAVSLSIVIGALYNSVEVLDQVIYSLASCSFHWVLYLLIIALKSLLLFICVVVVPFTRDHNDVLNTTGFTLLSVLNLCSVLVLFCSLDHEYHYRSPEYSSVDAPFTNKCVFITKWRKLLSWPRLIVLALVAVSIVLLIVAEVLQCQYCLHWVWLASSLLPRLAVICIGLCLLCRQAESFRPTIPAKLYLLLMIVLSIGEEIPNSILTLPFTGNDQPACFGGWYINLYNVIQLMGGIALLPLLLFVRSQYLRVEQESKLLVIWDMQKLLQVNGRHDITTH